MSARVYARITTPRKKPLRIITRNTQLVYKPELPYSESSNSLPDMQPIVNQLHNIYEELELNISPDLTDMPYEEHQSNYEQTKLNIKEKMENILKRRYSAESMFKRMDSPIPNHRRRDSMPINRRPGGISLSNPIKDRKSNRSLSPVPSLKLKDNSPIRVQPIRRISKSEHVIHDRKSVSIMKHNMRMKR